MLSTGSINRNSKLFQKFMQSRASKQPPKEEVKTQATPDAQQQLDSVEEPAFKCENAQEISLFCTEEQGERKESPHQSTNSIEEWHKKQVLSEEPTKQMQLCQAQQADRNQQIGLTQLIRKHLRIARQKSQQKSPEPAMEQEDEDSLDEKQPVKNQTQASIQRIQAIENVLEPLNDESVDEAQLNALKQLERQNSTLREELHQQRQALKKTKDLLTISEFKVKEMEEMLQLSDNKLLKVTSELKFYKEQEQYLTHKINNLKEELEKQSMNRHAMSEKHQNAANQRDKQVVSLRKQAETLTEENRMAKEYLYEITMKLYHAQQELIKYRPMPPLQEKKNQTIPPAKVEVAFDDGPSDRREPQVVKEVMVEKVQEKRVRQREFSKERAPKQSPIQPRQEAETQLDDASRKQQENSSSVVKQSVLLDTHDSIQKRVNQIVDELERIRDSKVMTGRIRRQKIELERELEELGAML